MSLLLLAALMVRHRSKKLKRQRQEATVWPVVGELLLEMAALDLGTGSFEERQAALREFLDKFCEPFEIILE